MPEINWSLDVGDLVVAVLGLVFIPVTKTLVSTLWSVKTAVEELGVAVFGTEKDRSIGIVSHISELRKESQRHRNWLVKMSAEQGIKIEERS